MHPIDYLQQLVDNHEIAGAALRIRKGGKLLVDQCVGWADIENQVPVTADTMFRLASMTKPIVGLATMQLVEQGRLRLDDPIETYLPAFRDMLVAVVPEGGNPYIQVPTPEMMAGLKLENAKRPVTIGMLLSHSSGIGHGPISTALGAPVLDFTSLERGVAQLSHLPLDFHPGEGTGYSAFAAFDIMGRIIEVVSGETLEDYFANHIFKPLDITDMGFLLSDEQRSRLSHTYEYTEEKTLVDTSDSNTIAMVSADRHGYFCGGGGLIGSLNAYDRIAQMYLNGGSLDGVQLLKPETVQLMATPYYDRNPMPGFHWGLSMGVYDGVGKGRWMGPNSFGWSGALGTHFYADRANELCVTMMISRSNLLGVINYIYLAVEEAIYKTFIDPSAE